MTLCASKNVIVDEFRFKINQLLQLIDLYSVEYYQEPSYTDKMKDIKIYFLHHNDNLEDLCYVEKKLISIAPPECLRKYYLQITSRYKEVLPKEARAYIYKTDDNLANPSILREETFYISVLLHKYYHFLDNKEKVISNYKLLFIVLLLIIFVVSGASFLFTVIVKSIHEPSRIVSTTHALMLVVAMICAGYFGAVISIVRRIQTIAEKSVDGIDREDLLLKLVNGKWGIFLSIVLGTLAPFVLLLLLFIFQGIDIKVGNLNVLPQFCGVVENCADKASDFNGGTAMSILYDLRFATRKDVAEFILLSIACGFSERFIPDVLDRVSKELDKKINDPQPEAPQQDTGATK